MKGNPPGRRCAFRKPDGTACRAKPLHKIDLCFWHDPEHKEEADKARQLGGQRRRRESTLAGAYDVEGLTSTGEIRRLLEVAAYDTLALDSSVPRSRALVAIALAAGKLLEAGELEERIAHLEAAVQNQSEPPVFPAGED